MQHERVFVVRMNDGDEVRINASDYTVNENMTTFLNSDGARIAGFMVTLGWWEEDSVASQAPIATNLVACR
jgi:hypothetical protein